MESLHSDGSATYLLIIWVENNEIETKTISLNCFSKYICVAKIKALISFEITAQLMCAYVFAYVICWFSNAVAQFLICHSCLVRPLHEAPVWSHLFLLF